MTPPDFAAVAAESIVALRERLRGSGFDEAFIAAAEAIAPRLFDGVRLPIVHAWLRAQTDARAILARLFAYADAVPREAIATVLGEPLLVALADAQMIATADADVRSRIRIVPLGSQWIASDPMEAAGDPVMGPGATTLELARAMPIDAGARVLDIGTGAGSLALRAAAMGASEVVGVDLHPRAAAVATFNAVLNGVRAEFLTGDLTAPVAGRRFDLVVSQPPFVMQPASVATTTYLHGGARGDELTMRLVAQLPAVLAEGGRALVLFETPDPPAVAMQAIAHALGPAPLRVIAIATPGHDAALRAIGYAAVAHPQLDAAYARAAAEYYEHLRALGIERVQHVLLDVRRDVEVERGFAVAVSRRSLAGFHANALRRLEAAIDLAAGSDADLLDARLRVTPGATIEQAQSLDDDTTELRIRFTDPGRDPQALSDAAAIIIDALRTPTTGAAALQAYAEAAEAPSAEVHDTVVAFLRSALASGLITAA